MTQNHEDVQNHNYELMLRPSESPANPYTKKTVAFYCVELADIYALKTFHDYLKESNFEHNLVFTGNITLPRAKEILTGTVTSEEPPKSIDCVVETHSDLGATEIGPFNHLSIDCSVLKNCAKPLTPDEKAELRSIYEVPKDVPIVVISYAKDKSPNLEKVVNAADDAFIYIVGNSSIYNLPFCKKTNVRPVTRHGVLKQYYALADLAINAENLERSGTYLHNFVEATEGGPLFMINPESIRKRQYGYAQLVDSGVIREFHSTYALIEAVKNFVRNLPQDGIVAKRRAEHLSASRARYLPALEFAICAIFAGKKVRVADLHADDEKIQGGRFVKLTHPDTDWGTHFKHMKPFEKPEYKPFSMPPKIEPIDLSKYFSEHEPIPATQPELIIQELLLKNELKKQDPMDAEFYQYTQKYLPS